MKPQLVTRLLFILLISVIYIGCNKEDYLPGLTGSMVGYLYTFDEFGNLLDDHSQVKITAFGIDQAYTAHSDEQGRFKLAKVPTGTYELHFEKNRFGVLKHFGVQHLGGNPTILPSVNSYENAYFLYEKPTTSISNLTFMNDSVSVNMSFTTATSPDRIRVRFYFSTAEGFSSSEAEYTDTRYLWDVNGSYVGKLYFQDAPFKSGETVYVIARCIAEVGAFQLPMQNYRTIHGVDTYFDYENNETIYPGLGNESDRYSFIFPD